MAVYFLYWEIPVRWNLLINNVNAMQVQLFAVRMSVKLNAVTYTVFHALQSHPTSDGS